MEEQLSELSKEYDRLQAAWRIGISLHPPDWNRMRKLHERICAVRTLMGTDED